MFDLNTSYLSGDGKKWQISKVIFTSPSITIIALCTLSFFLELMPGIGPFYLSAFEFDPGYHTDKTLDTYYIHLPAHRFIGIFFSICSSCSS